MEAMAAAHDGAVVIDTSVMRVGQHSAEAQSKRAILL